MKCVLLTWLRTVAPLQCLGLQILHQQHCDKSSSHQVDGYKYPFTYSISKDYFWNITARNTNPVCTSWTLTVPLRIQFSNTAALNSREGSEVPWPCKSCSWKDRFLYFGTAFGLFCGTACF